MIKLLDSWDDPEKVAQCMMGELEALGRLEWDGVERTQGSHGDSSEPGTVKLSLGEQNDDHCGQIRCVDGQASREAHGSHSTNEIDEKISLSPPDTDSNTCTDWEQGVLSHRLAPGGSARNNELFVQAWDSETNDTPCAGTATHTPGVKVTVESPLLGVGRVFYDKAAIKRTLHEIHKDTGRSFIVQKSDKHRLRLVCVMHRAGCEYALYAVFRPDPYGDVGCDEWHIIRANLIHTCTQSEKLPSIRSATLAAGLLHLFNESSIPAISTCLDALRVKFGQGISRKVAINARREAMMQKWGCPLKTFNLLPNLRDSYEAADPDNRLKLERDASNRCEGVMWAIGSCVRLCQASPLQCALEFAPCMGRTAGGLFIISFRISGTVFCPCFFYGRRNDRQNWEKFLKFCAESLGSIARAKTIVIADQEKAVVPAFKQIKSMGLLPEWHLFHCASYLWADAQPALKTEEMNECFGRFLSTPSVREWTVAREKLEKIAPELHEYFRRLDFSSACVAKIPVGYPRGPTDSNWAESTHSEIEFQRRLPILSLVTETTWRERRRMKELQESLEKCSGALLPLELLRLEHMKSSLEHWTVEVGKEKFNVSRVLGDERVAYVVLGGRRRWICSCASNRRNTEFWCEHILATVSTLGCEYGDHVHPRMTVCYWRRALRTANPSHEMPLGSLKPRESDPCLPPQTQPARGRPKLHRKRRANEFPLPRGTRARCSRCKVLGHNIRSCTEPDVTLSDPVGDAIGQTGSDKASARQKGSLDAPTIQQGQKRCCTCCRREGHNRRTCPSRQG